MKPIIYFYIPVRNEQNTIGVLLYRLMQVMREVDMDYEVYLTLDGCTDESAQVVEPYIKKLPLLVTQHEKRNGYARCLIEAIRKISAASQNPKRDFFMVLDGDFSFDPEALKEMAPGIERNSVFYLPDRMSVSKTKVGFSKRLANRLATRILHRRGADFPAGADLLSTVRGCRIQHLRRNMPRLEALSALDEAAPPAVCGALLYLAMQDNSKKTDVVVVREQHMRRAAGRFSIVGTLRRLMFSAAVERAMEDFEGGGGVGGGDDRRSRRDRGRSRGRGGQEQKKGSQPQGSQPQGSQPQSGQEQKQGEQPGGEQQQQRSGSRRSRGGRGRRGRRSPGGAQPQGQQQAGQSQSAQQQGQSGGAPREQQQQSQSGQQQHGETQGGEQRSASKRSRRRRRRPNKGGQGSSNTPQDNSQEG